MDRERRRRNYVFFLIAGAGLATTARGMTLSFLAIKLQQSFGLSPAAIGALLGLGPLLGAMVGPFAGSLSDRVGRKTVLVATLLAMAVSLVGMGLADTVVTFCLAQIASAVAIAIYEPIARALMSDVCPPATRLKYFSWRYTVSNAGWAVGPLIGIAGGAASTGLFLAAGLVYAGFAAAVHLLRVPLRAADAGAAGPALSLIAGIRAAACDPRLAFFVVGGMLLIAVHGQWSATLAPYLTSHIAGGMEIFAYLVSINGAVVLVGNFFARRCIERIGTLNALVAGCLLFVAGELAFLASSGFIGLAVAMTVFTLGEILVVPSEYMLVDGIADDRNRGSYFGAHSFSTIGNFVGPTLGGMMLGAFGGPGMFLMFAAFAGASAVLFAIGTRMPPPGITVKVRPAGIAGGAATLSLRGASA